VIYFKSCYCDREVRKQVSISFLVDEKLYWGYKETVCTMKDAYERPSS